jgi:hypothetical protein
MRRNGLSARYWEEQVMIQSKLSTNDNKRNSEELRFHEGVTACRSAAGRPGDAGLCALHCTQESDISGISHGGIAIRPSL